VEFCLQFKIWADFAKPQNGLDKARYSDPIGITAPLSSAAAARAAPCACVHAHSLLACQCRQVTWKLGVSSVRDISHSTGRRAPFISLAPDAGELRRPQNSSCPLPVRAPKAPPELCLELSYSLDPLSRALASPSPQPSRSPSIPAEAPPQVLHHGQSCSKPFPRCSLHR
jgi:hypothetical protein